MVEGVEYKSVKECIEKTKFTKDQLYKRLTNNKYKNWHYLE